ncbi:MAG: hypothetical protein IKV25_03315 [Clostridia bacterium]|nr:hypothetical protein [Clostridia bacterium]
MTETKFTYEQYCTFCKKNIIIEEVYLLDGNKTVKCTNTKCENHGKDCKNKLRENN